MAPPHAQLPTELLSDIITLALPPPGFSTFPERSLILRNFALVSPTWRVLAQAELFGSPVITRERQAEDLMRVLEAQSWRKEVVGSLRLRGNHNSQAHVDGELDGAGVVDLLVACRGLQSLWVHKIRAVMPSSLARLQGQSASFSASTSD